MNVLNEVFQGIQIKVKFFGLKINESKTKFLARLNTPHLPIGYHKFQSVDEIKFPVLLHSTTDGMTVAIQERVQAANRAYFAHVKLLKSKLLRRKTKIKIFKILFRPEATYGCQTWTLKADAIT